MKSLKRIILFLIILTVILPVFSYAQNQARTTAQAIELARNQLLSSQIADGSIGDGGTSDWAAMALAAAATNDSRFTSLKTYITAQAGRVDKNSATELERTILALTAVGVGPYNVGSRNLIDELKALATGGQIGSPNFLNDDIFAILAFRAAGQDAGAEPFKSVIEFVKRNQLARGGFNDRVGGQEADIDITAVAAVALAPYHNTAATKNFLVTTQNSDGGFPSRAGSTSSVASTSWTIWAIGLNQRATEYLIGQQQPNGSFGSILATSYVLHTLTGKSLPVGTVTAPAPQPAPQPANQQQPAPVTQQTNQQPTQQPAPQQEQPKKPDVLPVATPGVAEPVATQKTDIEPVVTPGVTEPVKPAKPSPKPPQLTQATQKRGQIPSATLVASVNQHSNLLLITSNAYPKETLAQTSFEARTARPPQLIPPKRRFSQVTTIMFAIAGVVLVSTVAFALLWRTITASPTELIAPRLALS